MAGKIDLSRLRRRQPWTESEGRAAVEAWRASGEALSGFARRHGVGAERLRWWKKRFDADGGTSLSLVPVHVVDGGDAAAFELVIGAHVVRVPPGFDAGALRRLLEVLASC